jgi:hypothetical protein
MSGKIKVGHVELDDYWVFVDSQTPLVEKELIRRAGMLPRDGTMVRCFRGDGSIVTGTISPGETVIIGSRPPPTERIEISESCSEKPDAIRTHSLSVLWSRMAGSKRSYGSGPIGRGQVIHIPGIEVGGQIKAIEVSRHLRPNGTVHAKGYRIRGSESPFEPGDVAIVRSTGTDRLTLFDPKTGTNSIEVTILENSLEATRRAEKERGRRDLWTIKILSFDKSSRSVLASVDRAYTWGGYSRRKITGEC